MIDETIELIVEGRSEPRHYRCGAYIHRLKQCGATELPNEVFMLDEWKCFPTKGYAKNTQTNKTIGLDNLIIQSKYWVKWSGFKANECPVFKKVNPTWLHKKAT